MSVPEGAESYQEAFERIEAAVRAGDADLRSLGFWRLVAGVKADAPLAAHWAETCLLYTSPSPRDTERSRMPSSA